MLTVKDLATGNVTNLTPGQQKKKTVKSKRTQINPRSPLDLLKTVKATTADEMAKEIEIDFIAEKRQQWFKDSNENDMENPDHVVVVRTDTDDYLGTVGSDYGMVQYIDMLRFTEELTKAGKAEYLHGGYIGKGEQAFVVMKTDSKVVIGPGEEIECYFFCSTSHNRTKNLSIVPTPYHKKSGTIFMPEIKGAKLAFRHSKHVHDHLARARQSHDKVEEYFIHFQKSFNMLASVHLVDAEMELYLEGLWPLKGKENTTRTENVRERVKEIYRTSQSLKFPATNGTLAGLYMAVCYWADHEQIVKKQKVDEESAKILSSIDDKGAAARRKAEALATALTLQKKFAEVRERRKAVANGN